jgi:FlaA1/EpsC-like NDP-sugar epimerase
MTDHPEDIHTTPDEAVPLLVRHRGPVTVAVYAAVFATALLVAFALAYNFHRSIVWFRQLFIPMALLAVPTKLLVFGRLRLYRGSWRYVGLTDLLDVVRASLVGSFVFILAFFAIENLWERLYGEYLIDRNVNHRLRQSVFLLDWAATVCMACITRVVIRLYHEEVHAEKFEKQSRVLIFGAGDTGEAVLRELLRMPKARYTVIGLLDDDPTHVGRTIHGYEVLGTLDDISDICTRHVVDEILIALPKASPREVRRVVEVCEGNNLLFRILPSVADLIDGHLQVSQLRDVDIEDLLGRDPVELDTNAIGSELSDKRILVTGAGGSIGSEMCRQIARFCPDKLLLLERAENNLFEIERELRAAFPDVDIVPYIADISDEARMRFIIEHEKPTTIFHAAAHKHVPMMEINPGESIKNNIVGTKTLSDVAVEAGVAKMVMISTDKAVNPTSMMGCTKRVAELYVQQLSARSETQFVTVRFGNVLGSSGSVVPIFRKQIAAGGPVTVTHPDMMRYFMTIPEAAQLVLQAGAMGTGGEIYVLDMGDPVKIVDLARDMITLSGLRPGADIEIVFSGTRPGEKLYEELAITGEDISPTTHAKIGVWKRRPEDFDRIVAGIAALAESADTDSEATIRAKLKELVPEFQDGRAKDSTEPAAPAGLR